MTSDTLYAYCAENEIEVYHIEVPLTRSMSAYVDNVSVIGIDERGMTEAEKRVHLAHEIGHCERFAFYSPYSPLDTRGYNEHKANMWAIKKLLPIDDLQEAIDNGYTEVWQLAEYFNLTEDFIRLAIWEYFDKEV